MKPLTCEMCGSTNLLKQDGVFVCQSCGTKYTVEEAKKMMVEGTVSVEGTVKVDGSQELLNLYETARNARLTKNSENARKFYEQILVRDPKNWEPNFYAVYYKSMGCKIAGIGLAAQEMYNALGNVLLMLKSNVSDTVERTKIIRDMFIDLYSLTSMLAGAAKSHYDKITNLTVKNNEKPKYLFWSEQSALILYNFGDKLQTIFGNEYNTIAAESWKKAIEIQNSYLSETLDSKGTQEGNINFMNNYMEKIRLIDNTYQAPELKKGPCYVATAVYGSYDCPEVWTLRRFRDYTLAETWYGRAFISTYYAISPTLVKWFGNTTWFKRMWQAPLDKLVARLQNNGVECTPYNDRKF